MSKQPEPNPGALVASGPKAIAIANRQLRIASQALAEIEQERYIEFFATHPQASKAFIDAVSRYYPLTESLIDRYVNQWNWGGSSRNERPTVERGAHRALRRPVGRERLGRNEALTVERGAYRTLLELIDRYDGEGATLDQWGLGNGDWNFWGLVNNRAVTWTEALIERYSDRLHWWGLRSRSNAALPWSETLIDEYADSWDWEHSVTIA